MQPISIDEERYIGPGNDSKVYLTEDNKILKVYDELHKKLRTHTIQDILELIKTYKEDTLKACSLLEENSNKPSHNHLILNGEAYLIKNIIIPQGEVFADRKRVYSIGQEFIEGPKFRDFMNFGSVFSAGVDSEAIRRVIDYNYNFDEFDKLITDNYTEIMDNAKEISDFINNELDSNFHICSDNMKIKPDFENKILHINITDLGNNLAKNYCYIDY